VRIVLDTAILVRSTEKSHGPARDLLLNLVASEHTLLLSNEMIHELARVLRYPRLLAFYGLSEARVYHFIGFLCGKSPRSSRSALCSPRLFAM
jgi:predicted nucleic acid-binding protein